MLNLSFFILPGDENRDDANNQNDRPNQAPEPRTTLNAVTVCKTENGTHIENTHSLQEPKSTEKHG